MAGREYMDAARELDAAGAVVPAAWAYEVAISAGQADLEAHLDLVVIYQCAVDPGFASGNALPDGLVRTSWTRALEVLDLAQQRFGPRDEIEFWRGYLDWIYGDGQEFEAKCRAWATRRESLVPSFFMYAALGEQAFGKDARALLESVRAGDTERKRYIRSVLTGSGSKNPLKEHRRSQGSRSRRLRGAGGP